MKTDYNAYIISKTIYAFRMGYTLQRKPQIKNNQ